MIILLLLVRIVVFALGAYLVFRACLSALRTFVLPRSAPDRFNRTTFIVMRQLFEWRSKRLHTYLERDRAMELYGCVSFFCTDLFWTRRAGRRPSEKRLAPGIARARTTSRLLLANSSRR